MLKSYREDAESLSESSKKAVSLTFSETLDIESAPKTLPEEYTALLNAKVSDDPSTCMRLAALRSGTGIGVEGLPQAHARRQFDAQWLRMWAAGAALISRYGALHFAVTEVTRRHAAATLTGSKSARTWANFVWRRALEELTLIQLSPDVAAHALQAESDQCVSTIESAYATFTVSKNLKTRSFIQLKDYAAETKELSEDFDKLGGGNLASPDVVRATSALIEGELMANLKTANLLLAAIESSA
jgi:hypothetical protein